MNINIVDNFVTKEYQNHIEKLINDLPLFFNLNTVSYEKVTSLKDDGLTIDLPQFTHVFIADGKICSQYWNHVEPIVFNFLAKTGKIKNMTLFKCKLNLNLAAQGYNKDQHFAPHIDTEGAKGLTAIYYVKDSDGDTLFFDKQMKVVKKITPKKGMLVYFDNSIYHSGQPPTKNPFRALINFNWIN